MASYRRIIGALSGIARISREILPNGRRRLKAALAFGELSQYASIRPLAIKACMACLDAAGNKTAQLAPWRPVVA